MYVRILIVIASLILIAGGFSYHLTSKVVGERNTFEQQAKQWALTRTSITDIQEVDEYRGKQAYAVVIGKNRAGTPCIAWMTQQDVVFDTMERAVTRDSVMTAVAKGFPKAKLLHLVPGIDGSQRFWEATLLDQDGWYRYIHYDFYKGNVIQAYAVQTPKQS